MIRPKKFLTLAVKGTFFLPSFALAFLSALASSASYDEALSIIDEYVEITSADDEETEDFGMEMM